MASDENALDASQLAESLSSTTTQPDDGNKFTIEYEAKNDTDQAVWTRFVAKQSGKDKEQGKSENNGQKLSFSGPQKYVKLAKFMLDLLRNKDLKPNFLKVGVDFLNKNAANKGAALLSKMGFPKPTPMGFSKGQLLDEKQQKQGNEIQKSGKDLEKFLTNVLDKVAKFFGISLNPTTKLSDMNQDNHKPKQPKSPGAIDFNSFKSTKLRPPGEENKQN